MSDAELTERVKNLEKITAYLHRRLFRAERRLLITGTLLTHADDIAPADKMDSHHVLAEKLQGVSPEFCLKLRDLDKEEDECCAHLG